MTNFGIPVNSNIIVTVHTLAYLCHPEHSEGSFLLLCITPVKILRAKALRMTNFGIPVNSNISYYLQQRKIFCLLICGKRRAIIRAEVLTVKEYNIVPAI